MSTPPNMLLMRPVQSLDKSPVLRSAIPDHESYRRYLVQAHEYLGAAYNRSGKCTFEQQPDLNEATWPPIKNPSINLTNVCNTGQSSPDLIIQDDIARKSLSTEA